MTLLGIACLAGNMGLVAVWLFHMSSATNIGTTSEPTPGERVYVQIAAAGAMVLTLGFLGSERGKIFSLVFGWYSILIDANSIVFFHLFHRRTIPLRKIVKMQLSDQLSGRRPVLFGYNQNGDVIDLSSLTGQAITIETTIGYFQSHEARFDEPKISDAQPKTVAIQPPPRPGQ
jgi:hypothetical protein